MSQFNVQFRENQQRFNVEFTPNGGGGGGTTNYNSLSNKPKINNTELSGNKSAADLGLAAAAALAPEYSSSSTYAVGDLVLKDGQLYECNTAISTAEAWNSSHWTSKTVADVTSSLIGDLNGKIDAPSTAGTSGQVLTSDGQGGQSWQTPQSGGSVSPYTSNPEALGTASAGSSDDYARGDHVHPMPTAANVGAIASPSSPSSGDFLVYNGSAWVAQSLSTWQGGSY